MSMLTSLALAIDPHRLRKWIITWTISTLSWKVHQNLSLTLKMNLVEEINIINLSLLISPQLLVFVTQSNLVMSLIFITSRLVRSCVAPSWSLWLMPFPSPSSWVCWLSMPPTALKVSRSCPTRPLRTTHDKCSGSRPHSSPGQKCWSWSGCWVSHHLTHIMHAHTLWQWLK